MPSPEKPSRDGAEGPPRRRRDPLRDVAGRIADGFAIDWDDLLARTDERFHSRLRRLRGIEQLTESCRERTGSGAPPSADAAAPEAAASEAPVSEAAASSGPLLFRWGGLHVLEKVGEGGFGEVYRAWDPVLEREVALKLRRARGERRSPAANEEARRLHLEEARRLARLRHPNVLTVYGMEEHDGRAGLWTEFVHGGTLEDRLKRDGPLPLPLLERVARDLCRALQAAHDSEIIHGDVKASNVMVNAEGAAVLMDFGSASAAGERFGTITGTPLAMAPELFQGAPPSVASDLYALGVLLYRLASGRYPFEARTRAELERRVKDGGWIPLRELRAELPELLSRVIERVMAQAPDSRYRTARQMEAALAAAAGSDDPDFEMKESSTTPRDATSFIGRARELRELSGALLQRRLVTLTGPGGSGKTRLARRAVSANERLFPDGVLWVSLASLGTADHVWREIARQAGVRESGRVALEETVREALRPKAALLVLDNCEHLRSVVTPIVAQLLDACPQLSLLATSRSPLGVRGEVVQPVPPLEVPPKPRAGKSEGLEIAVHESVRLFVDRAAAVRPGFALSKESAAAVARICRRVDGIPLALELAAARARSLAVEEIASRLEAGLAWLRRAGDEGEARARTLEASIDWSWRLLDPEEQQVLRRLSAFAGRFSLSAAEAVAGEEGDPGATIDRLDSLVEKSLVVFEVPEGPTSDPPGEGPLAYRLLQPVRELAATRLEASGEREAILRRHFDHVLARVAHTDPLLLGADQDLWLARLESELDDVRAALRWAQAAPERATLGLEICRHLRRFWLVRGYFSEGMTAYRAMLEGAGISDELRGRSLVGLGSLAWGATDLGSARRYCEEALAFLSRESDPRGYASAVGMLGTVCSDLGDPAAARLHFEDALAIHVEMGNPTPQAALLCNLGATAGQMGDLDSCVAHYLRSLEIYRGLQDRAMVGMLLGNLCAAYLDRGEVEPARAAADEALQVVGAGGDRRALQFAVKSKARVALAAGEPARAWSLAVEVLTHQANDDDWRSLVQAVELLADAESALGRPERAATFLGVARAHRERLAYPAQGSAAAHLEQLAAALRSALGVDRAEAVDRRGRMLSMDELLRMVDEEHRPA